MTNKKSYIELPALSPSDDKPLVSVLIASYKAERSRINRLLCSIAEQPYQNIEVVIVDSSCLSYLAETAGRTEWIIYIPSEPRGVAAGFNEAISGAKGEILAVIADDDFVTSRRFAAPVEKISNGADIVYGDVYDLDEKTGDCSYRSAMSINDPDELWVDLFRGDGVDGSIPAASVTFRAECVEDERFHEELAGGEDYHLWVRLFEQYNPAYVPEPLAVMRQHDESLSSDPDLMYENRVQAINLLADRYPKLRHYADDRKQLEKHDYGRNLMFDGRMQEARSIFAELLVNGYARAGVIGVISLLPLNHEWIVRQLDEFYAHIS
jgi:glycosyltransferase involved in cell wall biosynthesis